MGRVHVVELEGKIYRCKFCHTHLVLLDDLVSKKVKEAWRSDTQHPFHQAMTSTLMILNHEQAFYCRRGKAYLFNNVVNIIVGDLEERLMLSGMHTVADIFCCCCGQIAGWKYEAAHEQSQKYKEGKYILERERIIDGIDSNLYLDTLMAGSDMEDT